MACLINVLLVSSCTCDISLENSSLTLFYLSLIYIYIYIFSFAVLVPEVWWLTCELLLVGYSIVFRIRNWELGLNGLV